MRGTFILPRPELEQQVGASAYVSVPERPGWERASCARWAQLASRTRQQEASTCMALPQQAKTPRVAKWA